MQFSPFMALKQNFIAPAPGKVPEEMPKFPRKKEPPDSYIILKLKKKIILSILLFNLFNMLIFIYPLKFYLINSSKYNIEHPILTLYNIKHMGYFRIIVVRLLFQTNN